MVDVPRRREEWRVHVAAIQRPALVPACPAGTRSAVAAATNMETPAICPRRGSNGRGHGSTYRSVDLVGLWLVERCLLACYDLQYSFATATRVRAVPCFCGQHQPSGHPGLNRTGCAMPVPLAYSQATGTLATWKFLQHHSETWEFYFYCTAVWSSGCRVSVKVFLYRDAKYVQYSRMLH
jgi:hypothetical protein